jgi:enoyl-CoA hydratase/carnithine racemase
MPEMVSFSREGDLAVIGINNPPVNALSPGLPDGIIAAIRQATDDEFVHAVILIGSGRTFIAGADIREFRLMASGRVEAKVGLYPLMLALEDCPKPVVCAMHGNALGGGLEVALACHYRAAVESAQLGQPEVKLGLIPGAGGTQRLPRLAGVAKALEMVAHGDPIRASEALRCGIIDHLIPGDLLGGAVAWTHDLLAKGLAPRKTRELSSRLGNDTVNAPLFAAARLEAMQRVPGQLAPLKAIEAVEAATRLTFEDGCRREEEIFTECLFSDQSKALIHVFFAQREIVRIPEGAKPTYDSASRRLSERFRHEVECLIAEGLGVDEVERMLREFGMKRDWVPASSSYAVGAGPLGRLPAAREEILERSLYALVNEGARLLEEGLPARAAHIDILCIRDCGFPPWRGGPMWHADTLGVRNVYGRICSFRERFGDRWAPAPLLERLAGLGQSFAEYDAR